MRLFVAHRISAVPAARIASIVSLLRPRLPKAAWVSSEAYHLTFAFLGEQEPEIVPRVSAALETTAASLDPVDARLAGGGFFPNARRPRVGWIGVEPPEPVIGIAGAARRALVASGASFDEKPFKPHLTLVRIREDWRDRDAALLLEHIAGSEAIPFRLDRISLFESRLLSAGAVHTELVGFNLS